jgi:RNA-directed DNA polymerase
VRYGDDCLLTGSATEWLETAVTPLVEAFWPERGLGLSPEKTRSTPSEEGFDFLGQPIRRYQDGKMLLTPSQKKVETV